MLPVLVALGVAGAACGDGEGIVETPKAEAPRAEVVEFTAGTVALSGFAFGSGDTAVVLAHMSGGVKEDWIDVAIALAENGVMSFPFDFRGYAGQDGKPDRKVAADLTAAVEAVRSRGASRVYVVGASMGAAAALEVAAREDLAGVVSVSSPVKFPGVNARRAAERIDEPSLFVTAEDDDPYAADAKTLSGAAGGRLVTYDGDEHGTELLTGDHAEELTALIIEFVNAPRQPSESEAPPGPAPAPS